MSFQIDEFDYINVADKASALGCNIPTELALLPRNFAEAGTKQELLHEDEATTVRQLWREAGIVETPLEARGEKFPEIAEKSFEWIGPTIFVGASLLSNNANLLSVALGVVSNYLTDFFRGQKGTGQIKIDIVFDTKKNTCKKIIYRGGPEGLKDFAKVVKEAYDRD